MAIVVDCSIAAAWALVDERTAWTAASLKTAAKERAAVPSLFWFELRNVLIINERRGRLDRSRTTRFLRDVDLLLEIDDSPVDSDVLDLARSHNLTVYDACYLELASRRRLSLCTLDRQLINAAPKIGVTIWQP